MNYIRRYLSLFLKSSMLNQVICLLSLASFLCLAVHVSNTTPLAMLAFFGLLSFFLPDRNRISLYTCLFIVFFVYHASADYFLFPENYGYVMYRRMLYAFFGGYAVFYALKKMYIDFILQQSLATLIVLAFSLPILILTDGTDSLWMHNRLMLFSYHPNGLGIWCAVMVISCVSIMLFKWPAQGSISFPKAPLICRIHLSKPLLIISFAAAVPMLWLTYSRSAFFFTTLICGLMIIGYLWRKRLKSILLLVLVAVFCLTLVSLALFPQFREKLTTNRNISPILVGPWNDSTFISRQPLWESGLNAFKHSPILGNGPESFGKMHQRYLKENYDLLVTRFGKDVVDLDTTRAAHAHNMYIMQLAESGIVGLVLLLMLLTAPLISGLVHRNLYGVAVPVLSYILLTGVFECPFCGSFAAASGITITFMILGYFSALKGAESFALRKGR